MVWSITMEQGAIKLIADTYRELWARRCTGVVRRVTSNCGKYLKSAPNLKALPALISLSVVAACAGTEPLSFVSSAEHRQLPTEIPAFAGERPEIIEGSDIYRLSASQQEAFLDFFHDPANRRTRPPLRLYEYLEENAGAFEYSEHTRTAEQVQRLTGGNCVSLANLTTALARLAGIDTGYQLINDLPVFEKQEQTILRGVHVRSVLFYDSTRETMARPGTVNVPGWFGRSGLVVDYFPTGRGRYIRRISEAEFTAMYYRNMAVEALIQNDHASAYWFTMVSLDHAPDHADAINMLAILYRRTGDDQTAAEIYEYGISLGRTGPTLLKNYRTMLTSQDRLDDAREITNLLATLEDTSPFDWWFMGEDAYEEKNYSDALAYYEKSVEIAPYLHEGYFGMAKSYYQLGRTNSARKAMRQAVENAGRARFRTLYEAKLAALSAHR